MTLWRQNMDPGVLVLDSGDSGGTTHIGLLREESYGLGDYRVRQCCSWTGWSDGDRTTMVDFHVGVRCMNYDPDLLEVPEYCS